MDAINAYRKLIKYYVSNLDLSESDKVIVADRVNIICNNTVCKRKEKYKDADINSIITYVYTEYMKYILQEKYIKIILSDPTQLVDLTLEDFDEDIFKKEKDEIQLRLLQKIEPRVNTMFKCRKCGSRNTTSKQIYTKMKADEATDFHVKCVDCKHQQCN